MTDAFLMVFYDWVSDSAKMEILSFTLITSTMVDWINTAAKICMLNIMAT